MEQPDPHKKEPSPHKDESLLEDLREFTELFLWPFKLAWKILRRLDKFGAWLRRVINSPNGANLAMGLTFLVVWGLEIRIADNMTYGLAFGWIPAFVAALIVGLAWPWLFIAAVLGLVVVMLFFGIPDVVDAPF